MTNRTIAPRRFEQPFLLTQKSPGKKANLGINIIARGRFELILKAGPRKKSIAPPGFELKSRQGDKKKK